MNWKALSARKLWIWNNLKTNEVDTLPKKGFTIPLVLLSDSKISPTGNFDADCQSYNQNPESANYYIHGLLYGDSESVAAEFFDKTKAFAVSQEYAKSDKPMSFLKIDQGATLKLTRKILFKQSGF